MYTAETGNIPRISGVEGGLKGPLSIIMKTLDGFPLRGSLFYAEELKMKRGEKQNGEGTDEVQYQTPSGVFPYHIQTKNGRDGTSKRRPRFYSDRRSHKAMPGIW
jgi:hypothetical protein